MSRLKAETICRTIFRTAPLSLAASFLIVSVAINMCNVVGRYVFSYAIYWAEEAMIYMTIWSIFLAAIATAYEGRELTMGLFTEKLPAPWNRIREGAMTAVVIAVCLFMAWQSLTIAKMLTKTGQTSLALEIPLWIPQSALLFGFVMIPAAMLARFLLRLREQETSLTQDVVL